MKLDLKGNTKQDTTTGKNLIDTSNFTTIEQRGLTITMNNDGTFNIVGRSTSRGGIDIGNNFADKLVNGHTYAEFCTDYSSTLNLYCRLTYREPDQSIQNVAITPTTNATINTSVNTLEIARIMLWVDTVGVDYDYHNIKMIIGEGSSLTEDDWEPYTNGASPNPEYPQQVKVVTGNNSVNIEGENLNYLQNLKWIVNSSGVVVTNNTYWDAIIDTRNHNSIYISGDFSLLSDSAIRVGLFTDYPALNSQGVRATITRNSAIDTTNCNYVLLCYTPKGTHTIDEIRNSFMVSYGNTQVPYTPYVSTSYPVNLGSLELCNSEDFQDYIYKSGDKWYKHEVFKKRILKGTQGNWVVGSASGETYSVFQANFDLNTFVKNTMQIFSDKTTGGNANSSTLTGEHIQIGGQTVAPIRISILNSRLSEISSNGFNTFLASNNFTCYIPLATPTDIEITDSTLIEQLDNILNAQSYDYQTNITQTNAILPFIITATARVERS